MPTRGRRSRSRKYWRSPAYLEVPKVFNLYDFGFLILRRVASRASGAFRKARYRSVSGFMQSQKLVIDAIVALIRWPLRGLSSIVEELSKIYRILFKISRAIQ